MGSLVAPRALQAADAGLLGNGKHQYRVAEGWGELPPGITFGDCAAVITDSKDNVYVFDGFAGWDPKYRIKVRIICARAYHALFMNNSASHVHSGPRAAN